jgi:hypothetical protein
MNATRWTMSSRVTAACGLLAAALPGALGGQPEPQALDIAPRATPVLKETAVDLEPPHWIADVPEDCRPQLEWVRSVWGHADHTYNTWKERRPWGDAQEWYYTWADVARFQGRLICTFTERNEPHNRGDTILHVVVSDDDGATWRSVAHYELALADVVSKGAYGGLFYGYLTLAKNDTLYMSSLVGGTHGYMMSATSRDGLTWSALEPWKVDGKLALAVGEIFRPGWRQGKCYGVSRGGGIWQSGDGLNWTRLRPSVPADGRVGGNETATTFVGSTWVVLSRSGIVSTSRPPYDRWDVNLTNRAGPHSHGGPNLKALPNGEVVAGSRGSVPDFGRNLAQIFKYDGKHLKPTVAFPSGATATGYPGLHYDDGHLYVAFMINGSDANRARGRICLAKIKWPLKPGRKSTTPSATRPRLGAREALGL